MLFFVLHLVTSQIDSGLQNIETSDVHVLASRLVLYDWSMR